MVKHLMRTWLSTVSPLALATRMFRGELRRFVSVRIVDREPELHSAALGELRAMDAGHAADRFAFQAYPHDLESRKTMMNDLYLQEVIL